MSSSPPGTIRFHQWCEPPLGAGDYELTLDQKVKQLGDRSFTGKFSFSVAGPGFALDPSEIYSVYPPKEASGDFANSLPHVVFTRRTLPWEKNLHPGNAPACGGQWMALLLLCEEDFKDGRFPGVQPRTVADLVDSEKLRNDKIAGPRIENLRDWQKKDPCNTIDLDLDRFQRIAPREEDLAFLAHVREVNTDGKETMSFLADGWFSVVIGNRFPQTQTANPQEKAGAPAENRALLISLEGVAEYLPGRDDTARLTAGMEKIRLAVLASWTFRCVAGFEFKPFMEKLDAGPLQIPLPTTQPNEAVIGAFRRGYAALNHSTRLGEKTVSWYRGPLTPVTIERRGRYRFAPAADALVRYDPEQGLMDVTYAAAFQLGRLLGLQDRSFAQSLCTWRARVQNQLQAILRREELQRQVNSGALSVRAPENEFLEEALAIAVEGDSQEAPPPETTFQEQLKHASSGDPDTIPPMAVCEWLARRLLLYGVPFDYLVPDGRMLPPNSMRFFSLDPGWIKSLLEGACSVGRSSAREEMVDEYLRERFFELAQGAASSVRRRPDENDTAPVIHEVVADPDPPVRGSSFKLTLTGSNFDGSKSTVILSGPVQQTIAGAGSKTTISVSIDKQKALPAGSFLITVRNESDGLISAAFPLIIREASGETTTALTRPFEGFLLNSPVVNGWQGLEMKANGGRLTPLRIDRLSPAILLCIFDGSVQTIEIRQPPEGMHFGATLSGSKYQKSVLRSVVEKVSGGKDPGDQISLSKPIIVPVGPERTMKARELAELLHGALTETGGMKPKAPFADFTSAEFGVQMTESPGVAIITVNRGQP